MKKRPILISLLCIVISLGTFGILYGLMSGTFPSTNGETIPEWFIKLTVVLSFVYLLSIGYLWKMQKRGVELYIFTTLIADVSAVSVGFGSLSEFIVPVIFIIIMLSEYKNMSGPSLIPKKIAERKL